MNTALQNIPLTPGTRFLNGNAAHSVGHDWRAPLTVVRVDEQSYGVTRYIVADRYGRRGYAY